MMLNEDERRRLLHAHFHAESGCIALEHVQAHAAELCRRERRNGRKKESVGCNVQRKSVIGAHNKCRKYLLCAITKNRDAKRDFEFIGKDNRQTIGVFVEGNENRKRLTTGRCCG